MTNHPAPLSAEQLDELERLAKAASHGPWKRSRERHCDGEPGTYWLMPDADTEQYLHGLSVGFSLENAAFIAAANPATLLALLAEVRQLRADAERYRLLRLRGDGFQWSNILRFDVEDYPGLDDAIDAALNQGGK